LLERHISIKILNLAKTAPVITITGPRQSGKTTLARYLFPNHDYISLEDPDNRRFALDDPRGFLSQFKTGVILDEVQKTPELFSYIQTIVDHHSDPGKFILTGSQNFLLMKSISQSLAGRTAIFHLLPFSFSELYKKKGVDLYRPKIVDTSSKRNLDTVIFEGFFPRIHDKKLLPGDWLADYMQTYVERDVRDVLKIGDLDNFRRFIALCAGRSGQILDMVSLGNDCGISHSTVKRWLSVLQTSFHIFLLKPHHKNFNKRIIKGPKLYFFDTGLLCYLLRIRKQEELINHPAKGAIFETFIISEYYKKFLNNKMQPDLYFWRDSSGNEIDLIIENGDRLIPIEIKSGQTFNRSFLKNLNYWCELYGKPESFLFYGGDKSFQYKKTTVFSWHEI